MVFAPPPRPAWWLAGALLLAAALVAAVLAGAAVPAALILAAVAALALAQRPRPAAPPFVGPMKRRASDFLRGAGGPVSILAPGDLPPPLREDLAAAQPFLDILCGQIDGVQQDVAQGVTAVVAQVEVVNRLSTGQRERIADSLSGVDRMRDALAVPRRIVARLGAMLAARDRSITENYAGLQTLGREFHELRGALDVISQIADKAFFLAINASVEAHRQGAAGQAFGLIATEMRALATQTAESARAVSDHINSFADRMQAQIVAALPDRAAEEGDDVLRLIAELEQAQGDADAISARLAGLIEVMERGHGEIVLTLSDILGRLQFEDVTRQRLAHVTEALAAFRDFAARSAAGLPPQRRVSDLLADQQRSYVMESQKQVHALFAGAPPPGAAQAGAAAPRIELF